MELRLGETIGLEINSAAKAGQNTCGYALQKTRNDQKLETPQAFANFSPGLFQPWVNRIINLLNAESVGEPFANSFRVRRHRSQHPQGCFNPGSTEPSIFGTLNALANRSRTPSEFDAIGLTVPQG